jgi:ATP-dependent DNA helicase RecG
MSETISNKIESTKVDYKVSLEKEKPKSWLKSVSAFANTSGGHIYFGFTDDTHEPIGLTDAQATASKIVELIEGRVTPSVRYELLDI